jgi:hypothetical protein
VAVHGSKGVAVAVWLEPADQGRLGGIPALSAVGAQLPRARTREGPDGSVAVLATRGVEVAAHEARMAGAGGEVSEHGFVGPHLGQVRLRAHRRMDVHHLEPAELRQARGENPFGPRNAGHRSGRKRRPGGCQHT